MSAPAGGRPTLTPWQRGELTFIARARGSGVATSRWYGFHAADTLPRGIAQLIDLGLVERDGGRLKATEEGRRLVALW